MMIVTAAAGDQRGGCLVGFGAQCSCRWRTGPGGAPVLEDVGRWFAGAITERLDSGDHVAFMLDPVDGDAGKWASQLGFQALRDLTPGDPT